MPYKKMEGEEIRVSDGPLIVILGVTFFILKSVKN